MQASQSRRRSPLAASGRGCCDDSVQSRLDDTAAAEAAAMLKALADPARLQILDILTQHTGDVCVCDLEGAVGLPDPHTGKRPGQPTVSHHLKVLRQAGLVGYTKRGLWAYYFVQRERLEEARRLLSALAG